ncbi:hypothetical protein Pflav_008720 [Phytohabitans flavus]|uniref:Oxidoreductase n=1 Tax=Phytohabitans flavus TaxID=1076124 RepID=A0A6F8XKX3_9ACTN|nr:SDR family NAD(P)-dependent oxidoreductase [Phytohabitans flavus]BCB74462.1 hypothetical protein Pflav_008720 [Phytohabitans flavus]
MKTIVITGGTDGLGRGLADTYLRRGHAVAIIGRDERKAASLPGAHFIAADLSLIDENRRVIEEINATFSTVDALVLCARYFRSTRFETAEGIEGTFALDYLSRFLLSYGLTNPQLIVNVSGAGLPLDLIHWDDLMLAHAYDGVSAQLQAGKANDLLGVNYAAQPGTGRARYVLLDPGAVSTSFAGSTTRRPRPTSPCSSGTAVRCGRVSSRSSPSSTIRPPNRSARSGGTNRSACTTRSSTGRPPTGSTCSPWRSSDDDVVDGGFPFRAGQPAGADDARPPAPRIPRRDPAADRPRPWWQ